MEGLLWILEPMVSHHDEPLPLILLAPLVALVKKAPDALGLAQEALPFIMAFVTLLILVGINFFFKKKGRAPVFSLIVFVLVLTVVRSL